MSFRKRFDDLVLRVADPLTEQPRTRAGVIAWWETRRVVYNLIVLGTGVFTLLVLATTSALSSTDCGLPDGGCFLVLGVVAYGFMANVCYTIGELAELLAHAVVGPEPARRFGAAAFTLGTIGSVVLTLVPAVLVPILCAVSSWTGEH